MALGHSLGEAWGRNHQVASWEEHHHEGASYEVAAGSVLEEPSLVIDVGSLEEQTLEDSLGELLHLGDIDTLY